MKFKSVYTAKETINKMKNTALRMGGNICKWNNWQGINLQNLQTTHVAKKKKKLWKT